MPVAESRNRSALKPTIKRNWKALLAAEMAINHPRRRRRIGINDKVILLADPLHFADVMIEAKMDALHIRKVGADIFIADRKPSLLHVAGLGKYDVADHIQFIEQGATNDPVKVGTRDQAALFFRHWL